MGLLDEARAFRAAITTAGSDLSDAQASTVPVLYNGFKYDGSLIPYKTRRRWKDGYLYVAQYDTFKSEFEDMFPVRVSRLQINMPSQKGAIKCRRLK